MELSTTLQERLQSLEFRLRFHGEPTREPFIFTVPNHYLRDRKDKAHEPRMVAIGPYHHHRESLAMMEQYKIWYIKSLLQCKNKRLDLGRLFSAVAELEEDARSCYADYLSYLRSDEFIEMLVLDGCFIIELLRRSQLQYRFDAGAIFERKWFLDILKHDLILFGNQIPFLVLCKLFDLINEGRTQPQKLIDSVVHFLELDPIGNDLEHKEVRDFLHLSHICRRPWSDSIYINLTPCPPQRECRMIPSATELKDANVTFRKSQGLGNDPFEVEFSNGVLTMSTLSIHDRTESELRNLILYEKYFPDGRPTYVTDHVLVLDCLINTGRDVEILSECGIIENMTGHNQVAADIINRLPRSAIMPQTHFIYDQRSPQEEVEQSHGILESRLFQFSLGLYFILRCSFPTHPHSHADYFLCTLN